MDKCARHTSLVGSPGISPRHLDSPSNKHESAFCTEEKGILEDYDSLQTGVMYDPFFAWSEGSNSWTSSITGH